MANANKILNNKKREQKSKFINDINPTKGLNNLWQNLKYLKGYTNQPHTIPKNTPKEQNVEKVITKLAGLPTINVTTDD